MHEVDAELAWKQTDRGTLLITDAAAVLGAARDCRERHGQPEDALPPRAAVDADSLPATDVNLAIQTLLSCGHPLIDIPGVRVSHANTSVDLSAWPPWPAAEN